MEYYGPTTPQTVIDFPHGSRVQHPEEECSSSSVGTIEKGLIDSILLVGPRIKQVNLAT